jgi:alkaline phosphatase D
LNASSYEELVNISQSITSDISNPSSEKSQPLLADSFGGEPGFYHGVASGDPLSNAVIVWTRYTPVNANDEVTVELRMAPVDGNVPEDSLLDPDVNPNLKRANILVKAEHDWIAKIDVMNLPSNTKFVFGFVEGDHVSDVGTTRTAPAVDESVDEMTYAVFSCAHFGNGYFHAYDVASTITDLDFWIHVGDYLYEYSPDFSNYASDSEERKREILPRWETIELQDYRLRHHTYLALDEGLRNLRCVYMD